MGKITLVRGAFHPHLEKRLFDDILAARETPLDPVVVLVGSNILARYLSRGLAAHIKEQGGPAGHMGIRFLTFKSLSEEMCERIHGRSITPRAKTGKRIAVRAYLNDNPCDYFEGIKEKPGLHNALVSTIDDLEDARVSPDDLTRLASSGRFPEHSPAKIRNISEVYRAVLDSPSPNPSSTKLLLDAAANAQEFVDHNHTERLFVYGIYDFTGSQRHLLEELGQQIHLSVYMPTTLPIGVAAPIGDFTQASHEWLTGQGSKVIEVGSAESQTADLTVFSCPGQRSEAVEALRVSIQSAPDIKFDEMLILYRGGEDYPAQIAEVLKSAGIPYYGPSAASNMDTRVGKLFRSLLRAPTAINDDNFTRTDLIDLSVLLGEYRSSWEEASRRSGMTQFPGNVISRLDGLTKYHKSVIGDPAVPGWIKRKSENALGPISELKEFSALVQDRMLIRVTSGSWADIAADIEKVFRNGLDLINAALKSDNDELSAIKTIIGAIKRVSEIGSNSETQCTLEDFTTELLDVLASESKENGEYGTGITVSDIMSARGLSARLVIVLGLTDGVFPAKTKQDPILLDSEKSVLSQDLDTPLSLSSARSSEEALLYEMAIGAATEKLVLTYPRLDPATGKNSLPSHLLLSDLSIRTNQSIGLEELESVPFFKRVRLDNIAQGSAADSVDMQEYDLARVSEFRDSSGTQAAEYLASASPHSVNVFRSLRERSADSALGPFDGKLSSTLALAASMKSTKRWSPSALEQWASCPFSFLLNRVMGVKSVDRPEEADRISPIEKGLAIHHALQILLTELSDSDELPLNPDLVVEYRERLREILNNEFEHHFISDPVKYRMLNTTQRDQVLEDLDEFILVEARRAAGDQMVPTLFEHKVGPSVIETPSAGSIEYSGYIDRLDAPSGQSKGNPIHIIDYKSGKKAKDATSLNGGKNMQPTLYLKAAVESLEAEFEGSSSSYYMTSPETDFKLSSMNGDDWQSIEKRLTRAIELIVTSCNNGLFIPTPAEKWDQDQCRYCDYKLVCQIACSKPLENKVSPELDSIRELGGIE